MLALTTLIQHHGLMFPVNRVIYIFSCLQALIPFCCSLEEPFPELVKHFFFCVTFLKTNKIKCFLLQNNSNLHAEVFLHLLIKIFKNCRELDQLQESTASCLNMLVQNIPKPENKYFLTISRLGKMMQVLLEVMFYFYFLKRLFDIDM